MRNTENFADMSVQKFRSKQKETVLYPLSKYAYFHLHTKGKKFYTSRGTELDKWEVFNETMTDKDIDCLINNKTNIITKNK